MNGLAVMTDEETWSLWDHITGEAFEGPLSGLHLDVWPISLTNVAAANQKYPGIVVIRSQYQSPKKSLFKVMHRRSISSGGFLPPMFRRSMAKKADERFDKMARGLGVIVAQEGKFYPIDLLPKGGVVEDTFKGRVLQIERNAVDGVPFARWKDSESPPMQLFTRWYGFSFTYPDCEIYQVEARAHLITHWNGPGIHSQGE